MYHYVDDKEFLQQMRAISGGLMQSLCHYLKEDHDIGANFYLVGSGARNLILQNAGQPVDLDYNLEIVRCEDFEDCRYLKECARKAFNKALRERHLPDCEDSTSSLTSKQICPRCGCFILPPLSKRFSIDICITVRDEADNHYRLIHKKTGFVSSDEYYWNKAPQSRQLKKKADYIKKHGKWELVREQYLRIKNRYLTLNDPNHPSFVCYAEAVNNVYNSRKHW